MSTRVPGPSLDRWVLGVLGDYTSLGTLTPQTIAGQVSQRLHDRAFLAGTARPADVTWQAAARSANRLVALGLASKRSLPKQVSYKITDKGREELAK